MEHFSDNHEDCPNHHENNHELCNEKGSYLLIFQESQWKLSQQHNQNFPVEENTI